MGGRPAWLSDRTLRLIAQSEARDRVQDARDERERQDRHEQLHQRALALYMDQAMARGEDVSPVDLAMGRAGRTVGEILAYAAASADREDAREAARKARSGAQPVPHVFVGEPVIVEQVTPERRRS